MPSEATIWRSDAPDGYYWECPECNYHASLGSNMGYHRAHSGHIEKPPVLCETPSIGGLIGQTAQAVWRDAALRLEGEAAGRAQAEAEIADWLEGEAGFHDSEADGMLHFEHEEAERQVASALRQAAEAVRQGRARREGRGQEE